MEKRRVWEGKEERKGRSLVGWLGERKERKGKRKEVFEELTGEK